MFLMGLRSVFAYILRLAGKVLLLVVGDDLVWAYCLGPIIDWRSYSSIPAFVLVTHL